MYLPDYRVDKSGRCLLSMHLHESAQSGSVIGERERANLVVRSSGIFGIYIVTSCKCASNALLFIILLYIPEIISKFLHIFTSRDNYAPIASPRTLKLSSIRWHALQPSVTDRRCTASKSSWFEGATRK